MEFAKALGSEAVPWAVDASPSEALSKALLAEVALKPVAVASLLPLIGTPEASPLMPVKLWLLPRLMPVSAPVPVKVGKSEPWEVLPKFSAPLVEPKLAPVSGTPSTDPEVKLPLGLPKDKPVLESPALS